MQYQEAVRLDPTNANSRIDLGLPGQVAETAWRRSCSCAAVLNDRQSTEAHHVLAAVLVEMGRIREAAAEFEEVLRLRPDHAEARAFLAMAEKESACKRAPKPALNLDVANQSTRALNCKSFFLIPSQETTLSFMQQTLIIFKPDCVQRRLVGAILERFEEKACGSRLSS